ncbi:MAG: iron-containing alcohol dehydrogenase [Bacteroidota bacterium]
MVKPLTFAHTPQIFFGPGTIELLPREIHKMGTCPLILTGRSFFINTALWPDLQQNLEADHLTWHHALVEREPSPRMIDEILKIYKDSPIDVVVAIGGGSVIDAGKAVSAMRCHPLGVKAYLEGVGNEKPTGKKIPFIAVPTTAGTGSEATKNAVLSEIGAQGFKKSLRHDNYVPNVAIVDPTLAITCSPAITASSGMDAFTQLLESYLSTKGNSLTDALALEGLLSVREGLIPVYEDGKI